MGIYCPACGALVRCLYFQNHLRYLPHVWYRPSLEHWLFMYETMPLGLLPGWGQRSLSRMMLKFSCLFWFIWGYCFVLGWDLPLSTGFCFVKSCPQLGARGQYLGWCNVNIVGLILLRYTVYIGILGQIEQPHQCSSSKTSTQTRVLDLYSWLCESALYL